MGSWARTGVSAFAQVTKRILQTQEGHLQGAITQSGRRGFASGHHSEGVTYEGLTLPKPSKWHVGIGKGMAGLMWFWIFYRFYHDKDHFLYGPAAHFEHELAHENDHVGEDSHH